MENVLGFFRNRWTKLGFSLISLGYGVFLAWLAWLTYSHFLKPTNNVSLFALYLLINIIFAVSMIYTRRQLCTKIVSLFFHPIILAVLFFEFGNWYLIVPPFVVATVIFFAARTGETLKTVLGTIYLILYVLGVIGYLISQNFSIKIFDVDLSLRSADHIYSPSKTYRIVKYVDPPEKENRTVKYYIEKSDEDLNLPFLDCEKYYNSQIVLAARYTKMPEIRWIDDSTLLVDGKVKSVSTLGQKHDDSDDEFSGETRIIQ